MEITDIKQHVELMKTHGFQFFEPVNLHVPDSERALRSVMEYFVKKDTKEFVWLPEYNHVAAWLHNNEGRGLCLYGTNGSGKTILIQKAIPLLILRHCSKVIRCFNYFDLNNHADNIINLRLLSIDDAGMEQEGIIYGNKRWVFPEIMDIAEKKKNVVLISSNLNGQGFCDKYGVRTFERIVATTKRIEFNYKSLRV